MSQLFSHRYLPYLIILLFLVCQIPFLGADADLLLSHSRGAWTDEGLYTLQLRNWLHTGIWNIRENDSFLRAPLFNAIMLPSLRIFGSSWIVARCTVLLLFCLICVFMAKQDTFKGQTSIVLFCLCFNPLIFHYSHLAMTEIPALGFLLFGLVFFDRSIRQRQLRPAVFANLFIVISVFTKISFVYAAAILPLTNGILFFMVPGERRPFIGKQLALSLGAGLLVAASFYFLWFLPNRDFLTKMFAIQSEFRPDSKLQHLWEWMKHNHGMYRTDPFTAYSVYLFYLNLLLALAWLFTFRKRKTGSEHLIFFCAFWLSMEVLKFFNAYLPSRYLISGVAVNILLFFFLARELRDMKLFGKAVIPAAYVALAAGGIFFYLQSFTQRSFQLKAANEYFKKSIRNPATMAIGNWASSCCWDSKVYSRYCVKDYDNQREMLSGPGPWLILSEPDEGESAGAFKSMGYDLKAHADSMVSFKIAHWQINAYWISH